MTQPSDGGQTSGQRDGFGDAGDVRLHTFFQPFYNLQTDRLQGLEVLARVSVDGGDPESPADFLSHLSPDGAREVDLEILDAALEQFAAWQQQEEHRDFILSVNLSSAMLLHEQSAVDILGALRRHGVPGDRLLLDITTEIFRHVSWSDRDSIARVSKLQNSGISFCLDGFTAEDLDLLPAALDIPVDIIKLDPRQLADGDAGLSSVADAVGEAGLPMVAAGIETDEHLRLARDLGVEWAQGFLLAAPMPAEDLASLPLTLTP